MTVSVHLSVWGSECHSAGNDAESAGSACREQSMAGMAENLQDRLRPGGSHCIYGHDPRIYETTVKSFVANDNGEVCAAELVKLSWQKDPESGRMVMHEIEGSNEIIPDDLVLIAAGFPWQPELCHRCFWCRGGQQNQCQNRTGPLSYKRRESLCGRRYA